MSSDSLDQLERLFQAASSLEPEHRSHFLDAACAGNPGLRQELEAYLDADSEAEEEGYLDTPALPPIDMLNAGTPTADISVDSQIGPYRVVKSLGQGGMGDVFLAVQNEPFKRYVALKIIRRGMDFGAVLQRFDMERQILASLNHPNIARLIDGGVTAGGLPYFAMEYIDGMSITSYCDTNAATIEQRLELFISVCGAVYHAHQNLVLHRDLKPSNILVTKEGDVKLLDFGIAKLLNPGISHLSAPVTQFDGRLMTPDYASPEQVRGESLSTATDVYSLGVVLYELLTGHLPHQLKRRTTEELLRIVCEVDPERPSAKIGSTTQIRRAGQGDIEVTPEIVSRSRAASPEKLRKILRGDLDNIVMKALRKEPGRRYSDPKHLREDLERFLKGLPVEAHQDSRSYRFAKWIRRRRVEAAAILLIFLSLAAGMAATLWQANVAARERDSAQQALETASTALRKSESVTAFLMSMFEASDPNESQGDTITVQELLQRGLDRVQQLADQPQVQAQMLDVIGGVYFALDQDARSRSLHEEAFRIRQRHLPESHVDFGNGFLHLGVVHLALGNLEEAESFLTKAIDHQRRYSADDAAALVNTLTRLGSVYFEMSQYEDVGRYLDEAFAVHQSLATEDSVILVPALSLLASTNMQLGLVDEAAAVYERIVHVQKHAEEVNRLQAAVTMNDLGLLLRRRGNYDRAEPYLRDALDMMHRVVGRSHRNVGRAFHNLATLYYYRDELERADSLFVEALDVYSHTLPGEHAWRALTLHNRGRVFRDQGRYKEAEALLQEALGIQEGLFPDEHFHKALSLHTLGVLYHLTGQYERARSYLDRALSMRRRLIGEDHADYGRTLQQLARFQLELGETEAARESLMEVRRIYALQLLDSHKWMKDLEVDLQRVGMQ